MYVEISDRLLALTGGPAERRSRQGHGCSKHPDVRPPQDSHGRLRPSAAAHLRKLHDVPHGAVLVSLQTHWVRSDFKADRRGAPEVALRHATTRYTAVYRKINEKIK